MAATMRREPIARAASASIVQTMAQLTRASYAILGLLALPRTEGRLVLEPKRLVEAGFATAHGERTGRRARTVYSITSAGRTAVGAGRPGSSRRPRRPNLKPSHGEALSLDQEIEGSNQNRRGDPSQFGTCGVVGQSSAWPFAPSPSVTLRLAQIATGGRVHVIWKVAPVTVSR